MGLTKELKSINSYRNAIDSRCVIGTCSMNNCLYPSCVRSAFQMSSELISGLTSMECALLESGVERARNLRVAHSAGEADAKLLQTLKGRRCTKNDKTYVITGVRYGYDGFITAHGYRILEGGKRGSKQWDIGFITAKHFTP